jgi:E3 ubiquitin-protein ligase MARCH6
MQELDRKSKETNMIYQPSQIARMGMGYLALSVLIFLLKAIITIIVRLRESRAATPGGAHANERNRGGHVHFMDGIQDGHELEREVNRNNRDHDVVGRRLLGVFECAAAIAKVVTLLLIKMLFLPLLLGIWLDLATLALFEKNWSDRVDYAGSDIVGSIFLHWVIGITFMLLVTVSVLQMREVAHPDILARVIKPQEPQPDLLGNLLRESGSIHTKRVLLSLGIYAILLAIHIWLPARLMLANNLGKYLPLFQPKFWHIIMPQIQVPAELFIFHLCMLGVLEKYKNKIGEMQHHWLLLMGDYLGMTNQLLPREVDRFLLVGALPVFVRDALPSQLEMSFPDSLEEEPLVKHSRDDILPLWSKLLSEPDPTKREDLIRTNISWMVSPEVPSVMQGIVHKDGKKYLSSHSYIRIPPAQTSSKLGEKTPKFTTSDLLPTCIGPYRLKQSASHNVSWKDLV